MGEFLIDTIFKKFITKGSIVLELPNGKKHSYGNIGTNYPNVTINVKNIQFFKDIISKGNLGLGESYMNEYFTISNGNLYEFIDILLLNEIDKSIKSSPKLIFSIATQRLRDTFKGKSYNVRRHYDIGFDIFSYMLDENLTYSCGYLIRENDSLSDLQKQKFQRILNKLAVQSTDSILDIGCGYGGFLIYAAENYGISGIGITNSKQHANYGNKKIQEKGLEKQIKIVCEDYRKISGTYDKIVSIGMLEHVPRSEYKYYFKIIRESLSSDGSALVHAVGCNTNKNEHDPFVQKYIFPNSNQPKLSEIAHQIEQNKLAIIDVENIIRHYRPTSFYWLQNFLKHLNLITKQGNYDTKFLLCWEYYLHCCVSAAKYSDSAVYQVLFHKSHQKHISYARI